MRGKTSPHTGVASRTGEKDIKKAVEREWDYRTKDRQPTIGPNVWAGGRHAHTVKQIKKKNDQGAKPCTEGTLVKADLHKRTERQTGCQGVYQDKKDEGKMSSLSRTA